MTIMKTLLLVSFGLSPLLFVAGCANEPSAPKKDDRWEVSTGVNFTTNDMSRVAPTRANPASSH